jgi:hypothetical protein
LSSFSPLGKVCEVQLPPPFVVAMTMTPEGVDPTAQQSVVVGQETAERTNSPLGSVSDFQVAPPFVVATANEPDSVPPTNQQSLVVGHEMASRPTMPVGSVSGFQILPPSVVTAIAGALLVASPRTQHVVALGHEIPSTSTR